MEIHESIIIERLLELVFEPDNLGVCVHCGKKQGGCEPDARNYKCENCGRYDVFGAEELLLRLS